MHRVEIGVGFGLDQFIKDQKQPVGIDAARVQVIVAIFCCR